MCAVFPELALFNREHGLVCKADYLWHSSTVSISQTCKGWLVLL
jgi:hypothetical protein